MNISALLFIWIYLLYLEYYPDSGLWGIASKLCSRLVPPLLHPHCGQGVGKRESDAFPIL